MTGLQNLKNDWKVVRGNGKETAKESLFLVKARPEFF